ncbi:hypothetical protein QQ045_021162 [Rhodiola kirilowii]
MGRAPCCSKVGLHRGPWTPREDTLLTKYIQAHGEGNWRSLPKKAGLLRCGKSCRLRWLNYLRPDIKRGNISSDEDDLIIRLHILLGNRWSLIAGRLPGRTDNEIKNYWNTHLSKKLRAQGIDPETHKPLSNGSDQSDTNSKKKKNKQLKRRTSSTEAMTNDPNKKQQTKNKSRWTKDSQDHASEKKHTVHLPKAVRVGSFSILPRNDSFISTITGDPIIKVQDDNYNNNNAAGNGAETGFFIGENDQACSGDNDYNMMTDGSDDLHLGFDDQYQFCADDFFGDEQNFNKMYDEYLQVLKTSTAVDDAELDSFAESLLV